MGTSCSAGNKISWDKSPQPETTYALRTLAELDEQGKIPAAGLFSAPTWVNFAVVSCSKGDSRIEVKRVTHVNRYIHTRYNLIDLCRARRSKKFSLARVVLNDQQHRLIQDTLKKSDQISPS